ncbi:MAG: hypothetical protein A2152_01010 [Candidatus Levybacteria bacterium RBG_16_35_6]|nr:MAG: hypothetical protein A2152_01010 [Candidatus Levybacteria bacterium RBG_16_35_6]
MFSQNSNPSTNQPLLTPTESIQPTSEPTTDTQKESMVEIVNYTFSPSTLSIKRGTTVTWTNQDDVNHDVVSDPNGDVFKSELFSKGESYSFTFDNVGTYNYYCSIHPRMKGNIEVTE